MIEPRDYQWADIEAIRDWFRKKVRCVLWYMPTGAGKSFASAFMLLKSASVGKVCWFIVHRRELLRQTERQFKALGIDYGIIAAGRPMEPWKLVQICSIGTLIRRIDKLKKPDLAIFDECLRGDSILQTELGPLPIKSIPSAGAKYVLSYDGISVIYRKILRFYEQGRRKTVRVSFSNGTSIVCTSNHLFYCSNGQWIEAQFLSGHSCASVDAAEQFKLMNAADLVSISKVTEYGFVTTLTMKSDTGKHCEARPIANADVASALPYRAFAQPKRCGYSEYAPLNTVDSFTTTISGRKHGILYCALRSVRQFSERCLGMAQLLFQILGQLTAVWHGTMGQNRHGGWSTKRNSFRASELESKPPRIAGMAQLVYAASQHACLVLLKFARLFTEAMSEKPSPKRGLMQSETSDSPGGFAMMDLMPNRNMRCSIPKVTHSQKTSSSAIGSLKNLEGLGSLKMDADMYSSGCMSIQQENYSRPSLNLYRQSSVIKWEKVESVSEDSVSDVYDIEVEGTHCFFANGILVHNCHHLGASTWTDVFKKIEGCYIVGLSASPSRADGRGLAPYFGALVATTQIRSLIDLGYLSSFRTFSPPTVDTSGLHTRAGDYITAESEQLMDKPSITGSAVSEYRRLCDGKRAIVFCVSIEHSQHVAAQFREAGYAALHIDGTTADSIRDMAIDDFELGKIQVLCNVDLCGEGLSINAIECVILLRPTQSLAVFIQHVGRGLRTWPGKKELVILDHVGSTLKFGMIDEPREWTLTDDVERRKKKPTPGIRVCPKCFAASNPRAQACSNCGEKFEVQSREVDERDGELEEVTPEEIARRRAKLLASREQGRADTVDKLVEVWRRRGYKGDLRGRAMHVLAARAAKKQQRKA